MHDLIANHLEEMVEQGGEGSVPIVTCPSPTFSFLYIHTFTFKILFTVSFIRENDAVEHGVRCQEVKKATTPG